MSIAIIENRLSTIVGKINKLFLKEKKSGYGGICIEMEQFKISDEEILEIVEYIKSKFHNVKYYGDNKYIPVGCQLYHNQNNSFVGKLLTFDFYH